MSGPGKGPLFSVGAAGAGARLSNFLRHKGVSLAVVRALKYQPDGILVNGERARTNRTLCEGDVVALRPAPEAGFSVRPQDIPLEVVYQSADALVVNKPAGMLTHPSPRRGSATLANAVCGYLQRRDGAGVFRPVGRLDADTSGLVLCAGNGTAAALLTKTMQKTYLALVGGALADGACGTINAALAAAPGSAVRQQVAASGRESRTVYKVLASSEGGSLVAVWPLSGRTHQIRAHFAHLGHPLLGDALYGGACGLMHRHALHCAALWFQELSGARPGLYRPPPPDMMAAVQEFGFEAILRQRLPDFLSPNGPAND